MPLAPETAARAMVQHECLTIETLDGMECVDITDRLVEAVSRSGVVDGLLSVQSRHTTAGIMINEHEPLLLEDLRAMFERLAPAADYAHDDLSRRTVNLTPRERRNGHAHCRAALLRTSETVSIVDGCLSLGRWQRVFFVDFDGGQRREVRLTILSAG
jgi:secondary thiamine-phosphate synthase enzyme